MGAFDKLRKLTTAFSNLDADTIVFEIIAPDKELQEKILDLIRIDQLFKQGISGDGTDLNTMTQSGFGYALSTIKKKRSKGQPTGHVTLFDKGDYYKSHGLIVSLTYIEATASPVKDDSNLFDDFGESIIDFTNESVQKLIDMLRPLVIEFYRNKINTTLA